jgi:hypothetical protein
LSFRPSGDTVSQFKSSTNSASLSNSGVNPLLTAMLAEAKKDNPNFRAIDPITGEKIVATTLIIVRIQTEKVTLTPSQPIKSL